MRTLLSFSSCDKCSHISPCSSARPSVTHGSIVSSLATFRLETGYRTEMYLLPHSLKWGKYISGILVSHYHVEFSTTRGREWNVSSDILQTSRQKAFVSWRMQPILLLLLCMCVCATCAARSQQEYILPVLTQNTSPVLRWLHSVFVMFPTEKFSSSLGTKTLSEYQTNHTRNIPLCQTVLRLIQPQSWPEPVCRSSACPVVSLIRCWPSFCLLVNTKQKVRM